MNSLFRQLNPPKPLPNNIKDMVMKFKGISNPQALAEKYVKENPQLASLIQAANGNPEMAFRNLAKQMNVDADEFINLMR